MLTTRKLALGYGATGVLDGIDLSFGRGEITALLGANGSGKSTLLRALAGLHPLRGGAIALDGTDLTRGNRRKWRDRVGYMPQDMSCEQGLTALEAVLLGSLDHLSLRISDNALRAACESLDRLGLLTLANRRLETLSGGQRQLVFFAQALMRAPCVLLLDEPVSALDLRHQMLLLRRVREATQERRMATVVVLHDVNLAAARADRIVFVGGGGIVAAGAPREVLTPPVLSRVYEVPVRVRCDDGRPWVQVLDEASACDAAA